MADELSGAIEITLKRLSMPEASLAFEWKPLAEPDEHGIEEVIIAFSANPGHPTLPLHKVASGGEKSRLMLAFKATGTGAASLPTIVLDEIDTGVSGKAAEEMAASCTAWPASSKSLPSRICRRSRPWRITT